MEYFNLTTSQQNIWDLQKFYEGTAIGNLCGAVLYQGERDPWLLQKAVGQVIRHQTALRLGFVEQAGSVKQYVKEDSYADVPVHRFADDAELDAYAKKLASDPIGLSAQEMYRFEVISVGEKQGVLTVLSHLISDAWTFGLLAKEVDDVYQEIASGTEEICETVDSCEIIDYMDHVRAEEVYLSSDKYEKDRAYWNGKYERIPEKTVIRTSSGTVDSVRARRLQQKLSIDRTNLVERYCLENPVTPAVLFETALYAYLFRINPGAGGITIGAPILNRTRACEKKMLGMFISTIPLTVEIKESDTLRELAGKITKAHYEAFRHQKYPYRLILEELREKRDFEGNLYDVMFSFQNARTDTGAVTRWYGNGYSEVPFTMHIDNRDSSDTYTLTVDYQTEIFKNEKEIEDIIERFEFILDQILENDSLTVKDIFILPDQERKRILSDFNDTKVDYPRDKCVHDLFTEQAEKTPDAPAVVFEGRKIAYRELDELSNVLAHILREKGVARGDVVPILAKRSWHILAAMLGILKAGAGYMPLSPDHPRDRLQFIIDEAKSRVGCVFGYEEKLENIELLRLEGLSLEDAEPEMRLPAENESKAGDLCYVIFTSGSTGTPKGVMVSHRNVTNYCNNNNNNNNVCHAVIREGYQRIISVTNIVFDIFVTESLLPLLNGMTVYLTGEEEVFSQSEVNRIITENRVEVLQTTPTKMKGYLLDDFRKDYLKTLKVIILGGEALSGGLYEELRSQTQAAIFNIYGPAETTVWSSNARIENGDITIGRPIANTQIYILDGDGNLLPIGVAGELCIAGEGVGLGYLNRPDLTAERFVPNPFATEQNGHGKILYHTGDLARWREDGEIEYLGRIDTQVKIRGLRIELGEIESVLSGFPGIRMCAVTDRKDPQGRQYLAGYYTTATDEREGQDVMTAARIDEKELRRYMRSKLPGYMVPNYFMHLREIPMTPSGKTDRRNLPEPDFHTQCGDELTPPQNEVERKILKIWKEELKAEELGCDQDFFEAGGDSLLAISLLTRLEREFGTHLVMKDIFDHRTVKEQAVRVSGHGEKRQDIQSVHRDRFLLTPQQRAVYLASQKEPESLLYNMPAFLSLPDAADRERLEKAIRKAFEEFQIFRMRVSRQEDGLYGIIDPACGLKIEKYKEEEKEAFIRPFDLQKAPLVRVGFTDKYLLIDLHHLISDGASLRILIHAVQEIYKGNECPRETVGYSDYADYLKKCLEGPKTEQGLQWYRDELASVSDAVTFPRAKKLSVHKGESYLYRLGRSAQEKEKEICGLYKITETMLHTAVYALLLKSYSGLHVVPGSIIVSNRQHFETANTMGMFVNTLPIAWNFEKKLTVEEYLRSCKEKLLKLYEYEEIPFATILETLGAVDTSWFNTSFVYQANAVGAFALEGQSIVPELVNTHTAKFDLTVEVTPNEDGTMLRLEYRTEKVDRQLAMRLAQSYERILLQLAEKKYVNEISALSEEEKEKILYRFNDTKVDYPRDKCVHELFTEQAEKTPDAPAVVFEGRKIAYRELDELSNVLAHILREKGVGRGDVVPILAKRSWHILAAMLGILKAGAGYMPLSPDHPRDRLQFIIDEAKSRVGCVFGYEEKLENIELLRLEGLSLEDAEPEMRLPAENESEAGDLCYVIFTSGSTGTPKGVMVSHRNVTNYCNNNNNNNVCHAVIREGYQRIISVTNIVFDIFVTESLLPLLNGMTVYLTGEEEVFSQSAVNRIITENRVEVLQTTPTKMKGYLFDDSRKDYLKTLKVIILGGEALSGGLYEELRSQTQAAIFNIYGPAETTVWSSNARIENGDITIGRPIANTQIYILDSDENFLPIGVAGELCIAGEGVGLGYLNRSDLTAERFVPNPFATEQNGHGKILYHTGDLARWREDGEIEYLGRIDTQVKIRGLRIELGEIESVLSGFPGIRMCVVTDRKDAEGRQYLAGYYTTATDEREGQDVMTAARIDEKELRRYMRSKLPGYMVPNYFMHLREIPMTPSGKTDRRNLPEPENLAENTDGFIEPVTEKERRLCRLMEEVLDFRPMGTGHDFFSCGGDSLKAIEFVVRAEREGIRLKLQDIFDYPTAAGLAERMEGAGTIQGSRKLQDSQGKPQSGKVFHDDERYRKYESFLQRNRIADHYRITRTPVKKVLLTGATGFLGAHILDALLRSEDCVVYCLVRERKPQDKKKGLQEILGYYFGTRYADQIGSRIIPMAGDITDEDLSQKLPDRVDLVIHAAATVKHYGPYDYFYRVNTLGTRNMAEYALHTGARFLHISTISVSGNSQADVFGSERAERERWFGEEHLYQGQALSNVYVRSKFEAECAVFDAMLRGLQANIIRVGNLTNRSSDYVFQPNYEENAFLSRIRAAISLKCLPDSMKSMYSEFSPVDDTADAIVRIAGHFNRDYTVFHVYSNRNLYFDRMMEILKELSVDMEVVDGETFVRRLKEAADREKGYIYEAFLSDMDENGRLDYETNIHIKNDFTISYLEQLGFSWTEIEYEYVRGYLDYFGKMGYL